MKVLLTGASGFVGRHALDALLEQGHEVHAVSRRPQALPAAAIGHEADLLERGAPERLVREVQPTHLLHMAWYALPGQFWSAPENERWIDASLRLLRAFGEAVGHRAVIAGTCAEYAWGDEPLREQTPVYEQPPVREQPLVREHAPVREQALVGEHAPVREQALVREHAPVREQPTAWQASALEPATLYGACKHATHIAAEALARELGVSLAWGRIFFLYGPGEDPARLVHSVARGLLAGEQVPTTDGLQQRDFMHVRDVASAFVALLGTDVRGAVNIATGQEVAVGDLVRLIAHETGGIERVRFGALDRRAGEPEQIVANVERLRDVVGFTPTTDLREGVAETVAWLREAS